MFRPFARLYFRPRCVKQSPMNVGSSIALVSLGIIVVIAILGAARHFFSADARWERRRRRSNSQVSTTVKRPMVKFNVRTKNRKKK